MNKYIFVLLIAFSFPSFSQNNKGKADDEARIILSTYVSDNIRDFPVEAKELLKSKLDRIATVSGMGGAQNSSRFIITANVDVIAKEITPTAPTQHMFSLEVSFYIGDAISGTKFSTCSKTFVGVAVTQIKAYKDALSQIKPNESVFAQFIADGKTKIIEYYNSNCDFIIKDAEALASIKGYDEAIYKLASVPSVCKDCYEKCLDKIGVVYKAKMEYECQTYISKATTLMAQENYYEAAEVLSPILPDLSCYPKAQALVKDINDHKCATAIGKARGAWASHDTGATSEALASVPSDSKCYAEAVALANEVKKYVKETENRDFEFMKQEHKDEVDIRKATIKAARDIGVAYGNGPKAKIVSVRYNVRGWW